MRAAVSRTPVLLAAAVFGFLSVATGAAAQQPAPLEALQVFLDCQNIFCDFDHFRREITFVSWVRDRQDAHVHILGTGQRTGGGGGEFTFTFIGLKEFAGRNDTLRFISRNTDTEAEVRAGQLHLITLGLMRYVAQTPAREHLTITYQAPTTAAPVRPATDAWNLWVFNLSINTNLRGEQQQRFSFFSGSVSANRTADNFKINLRLSGNYNRSSQELSTGTFVNVRKDFSASQLAVWSLGPRWSFGVRSSENSSTFLNQDLATHSGPAMEFDVYPYSQSTRRQLTIRYSPELASFQYKDTTIFGKVAETLPAHRLDASLQVEQPWGQIHVSASAFQYLHDLSKHRLSLGGGVQLRVVRGLNLNVFGNVERTKDQLYLPKGTLTDEEILVQRRQLGTNFQYFTFIGLSFRFGSKFANVVNSRMPGIGSGDGFFFSF
jgi:hypothetical protein